MHDVPVEPANGFPWVQIEQILVSLICCQTPDVLLSLPVDGPHVLRCWRAPA